MVPRNQMDELRQALCVNTSKKKTAQTEYQVHIQDHVFSVSPKLNHLQLQWEPTGNDFSIRYILVQLRNERVYEIINKK